METPTNLPGSFAGELGARRQVGGVRSAETEGHAEALGGSDGDVRAEFAGRFEKREGKNIGGDDHHRAGGVRGGDDCRIIDDGSVGRGILQQHAAEFAGFEIGR